MLKKQLFIGANWKMNEPPVDCYLPNSPYRCTEKAEVCVFLPLTDWQGANAASLLYGAQCGRPEVKGVFTGDVSMQMLKHRSFSYVLCGHSERRQHHQENDEYIALQVASALENGLTPILCIGENADQREMDETKEVLAEQLVRCVHAEGMIVAYEPVWAIGTGKTPTPEEANEIHAFIRSLLKDKSIRIIYGGSVTGGNAAAFLAQQEIDGALVGGASLKPEEFRKIVEAAKR